MEYDRYNREERSLCAHLFRLLHEGLTTEPDAGPLRAVIDLLSARSLRFSPACDVDLARSSVAGTAILTEVALVRDAYAMRKPDVAPFMDALVAVVARQESVSEFRRYSELPAELRDPRRTHPKQIAEKARPFDVSDDERRVYGAVQGVFNAKPDLALVLPSCVVAVEAKLTTAFDSAQLRRTRNIAELWAVLLHRDLGFEAPPPVVVATLGDAHVGVDLSWQELLPIARKTYQANDRSRMAFEHAVAMLGA